MNSDLIKALEWAAIPEDSSPLGCSIGADVVNMSIGSEARPDRLNSGQDRDLVSLTLNRLAVTYGTLFVGAVGNSGPFMGSSLEAPGSAAQVLSVAAAVKDYDLTHDDTLSGDTCAGWVHDTPPTQPPPLAGPCGENPSPLQLQSLANFSSRGSGAGWLRPDIAGPGYYVVSAQPTGPSVLAGIDTNPATRSDPLYATASGTSMATPAVAGSAAVLLEAYRDRYGADPTGASGLTGFQAPAYALLKAALMNTAGPDLYEGRVIVTTPFGSLKVDPRNGPSDPHVGPPCRRGREGERRAGRLRASGRRCRLQRRLGRRGRLRHRPTRSAGHLADRRDQGRSEQLAGVRPTRRARCTGNDEHHVQLPARQPLRRQPRRSRGQEFRRLVGTPSW